MAFPTFPPNIPTVQGKSFFSRNPVSGHPFFGRKKKKKNKPITKQKEDKTKTKKIPKSSKRD